MTAVDATLAYVFWHRPDPTVAPVEYEAGLSRWHASLRQRPPEGLEGSRSYRSSGLPWTAAAAWPIVYVDWYILRDWAALGRLNHGAVRPPHAVPHEEVARRSADGQGSLYLLRTGSPTLAADRFEAWSARPPGRTREEHVRALDESGESPASAIWQRQLALGPAPEYCRRSVGRPAPPAGACLDLRPVS